MNKTVSRNQTKMAGKNIHLMIGSFVLLLNASYSISLQKEGFFVYINFYFLFLSLFFLI